MRIAETDTLASIAAAVVGTAGWNEADGQPAQNLAIGHAATAAFLRRLQAAVASAAPGALELRIQLTGVAVLEIGTTWRTLLLLAIAAHVLAALVSDAVTSAVAAAGAVAGAYAAIAVDWACLAVPLRAGDSWCRLANLVADAGAIAEAADALLAALAAILGTGHKNTLAIAVQPVAERR
jgi:hypothetical protein